MKKALFVDEKKYRFSYYYNKRSWWLKNGVNPVFKAYETKKDKWLIYLWLIFNKPDYVIFVQLSVKNIILTKLCNIIGVKTLFWQHGVFTYQEKTIKKYRKIGAKLDILLTLSNFDTKQIKKYFKRVHSSKKIFHYDSSKLSHGIVNKSTFLFIGQILTKQQIEESKSKILYDVESENLVDSFWQFLNHHNKLIFYKKHPGDKSKYLENISDKFKNVKITENTIIPKAIVGHFSTLIIPYLNLGVPFIQIKHKYNKGIDFLNYHKSKIYEINSINDISNVINEVEFTEYEINKNQHLTISELLLNIIN